MVDKIAIARISKTIVQVAVIANKLYTYQNKERVGYKNAQLFFLCSFPLEIVFPFWKEIQHKKQLHHSEE